MMRRAASFERLKAGKSIAARMAIIAMTTSNSMRVKPRIDWPDLGGVPFTRQFDGVPREGIRRFFEPGQRVDSLRFYDGRSKGGSLPDVQNIRSRL